MLNYCWQIFGAQTNGIETEVVLLLNVDFCALCNSICQFPGRILLQFFFTVSGEKKFGLHGQSQLSHRIVCSVF